MRVEDDTPPSEASASLPPQNWMRVCLLIDSKSCDDNRLMLLNHDLDTIASCVSVSNPRGNECACVFLNTVRWLNQRVHECPPPRHLCVRACVWHAAFAGRRTDTGVAKWVLIDTRVIKLKCGDMR